MRSSAVRIAALLFWSTPIWTAVAGEPQVGGELRFCIRSDPRTFDPARVADDASETVRYLTGGVLIRVHRQTQRLEPELAESWKVLNAGRTIVFKLREGLVFSDGTPFAAEDVVHTVNRLMDPAILSPTADAFRSARGTPRAEVLSANRVSVMFPAPVAGLEALFDQVAVTSSRSPKKEAAVLGPFALAEHKPGSYVLLRRNERYWKKDSKGRALPYLDSIRLDIQQNREIELARFRRGEIHLMNSVDPEIFERLAVESPGSAIDAGPTMEGEMIWFNQAPGSPLPSYKKAWFRSQHFRRAISEAIQRQDICRLAFRGHAIPGAGPFSEANRFWYNSRLKPHPYDPASALQRLRRDGFRLEGGRLLDREGHPVEFSLATNSGNKVRSRIASMVQQDLAALGVRLNIVSLDMSALIERITRTFDYEACLLGLVNVDLDPNGQMNVWLSSAGNHQWNPSQKSPATEWEAEIDRLMQEQASTADRNHRKRLFDRVQEIAWAEAPFLYLAHRNALTAFSPALRGVSPVPTRPQAIWNAERLSIAGKR